ncbi:hypothetical protein VB735_13670 [Halotia wernerae UHCC 0503]|nr:hypothetical protein [Halotia wernerae UHCC 0503]
MNNVWINALAAIAVGYYGIVIPTPYTPHPTPHNLFFVMGMNISQNI